MQTTALVICIISSALITALYSQLNTQSLLIQNYNLHWQQLLQSFDD